MCTKQNCLMSKYNVQINQKKNVYLLQIIFIISPQYYKDTNISYDSMCHTEFISSNYLSNSPINIQDYIITYPSSISCKYINYHLTQRSSITVPSDTHPMHLLVHLRDSYTFDKLQIHLYI